MFAFDRSALAVLVPLVLLLAVVMFNRSSDSTSLAQGQTTQQDQAVAANLPSR